MRKLKVYYYYFGTTRIIEMIFELFELELLYWYPAEKYVSLRIFWIIVLLLLSSIYFLNYE